MLANQHGASLTVNLAWIILLWAGLPACLAGQAIIEHAVISGGAATAAGSTKGAAGAIDGVLKKLDGTLDTAGKKPHSATAHAKSSVARAAAPAVSPIAPQLAEPSESAKTYEDPVGIKAGMPYLELLRRFGAPSMQITSGGGEQTLYYFQKDGRAQTQVRVSGGQVLAVDTGGKSSEPTVDE
jgi:hypothetical protein